MVSTSPSTACCGTVGSVSPYDFNGDGFIDLAVGVEGDTVNGVEYAGAVNVIYGSATGLSSASNQIWHQDSPGILGIAEAGDGFGRALTSDDFNDDGYADLAVGAPLEHVTTSDEAGAVHVIFGSPTGLMSTGNQLWTQDSAGILNTAEVGDHFGESLAAGQLGNGSAADLVIGVPYESIEPRGLQTTVWSGAVQVLYGSSTGLTSTGNQAWSQDSAGVQDTAEQDDLFGWSLAVANVGGDTTQDLVVGVPYEGIGSIDEAGIVQVLLGSTTGVTATGNTLWSQNSPGVANTAEATDHFGLSLAAADFGGSSHKDLAIGAPHESYAAGVSADGVVHVIPGSASGLTSTGSQLWSQNTSGVLETAESYDNFGSRLSAGDLGKDSHQDLAVTAEEPLIAGDDFGEGLVHVLYGSTNGLNATGNQIWHPNIAGVPDQVEDGEHFGDGLRVADFGNSPHADLAAGSPCEIVNGSNCAGAVTVLYGATAGVTATGSQIWTQDNSGIEGTTGFADFFGGSLGS